MAVYENSRYTKTKIQHRKGWDTLILKKRDRFKFNEENCQTHIWVEGDTLDGISYRYYGLSSLRWAILDANPKYRTEFDIKNGDVVLIPNYNEVAGAING